MKIPIDTLNILFSNKRKNRNKLFFLKNVLTLNSVIFLIYDYIHHVSFNTSAVHQRIQSVNLLNSFEVEVKD